MTDPNSIPYETLRQTVLGFLTQYGYHYNEQNPFTLSSGLKSPEYLDCRAALSYGFVLEATAQLFLQHLSPHSEALGGLTLGADPLAIATVLAACRPRSFNQQAGPLCWFSVRKQPKNHGTSKLIEGNILENDPVTILDDVCTSGASTIQAINAALAFPLKIKQVLVLVDREAGGLQAIRNQLNPVDPKIPVEAIFTLSEVRATHKRILQNALTATVSLDPSRHPKPS